MRADEHFPSTMSAPAPRQTLLRASLSRPGPRAPTWGGHARSAIEESPRYISVHGNADAPCRHPPIGARLTAIFDSYRRKLGVSYAEVRGLDTVHHVADARTVAVPHPTSLFGSSIPSLRGFISKTEPSGPSVLSAHLNDVPTSSDFLSHEGSIVARTKLPISALVLAHLLTCFRSVNARVCLMQELPCSRSSGVGTAAT
ncbi:hypothetical protein A0H81_05060 [Grifola frondosa]|uniref:Uncharacterized protein n=1 Tax=Grifola frondosa TaxID=5627 RepID=A0A1C7MF37_GRIFR|nr:hypothetical protein A0H81_05060 [Grifola frondosa]